MVQATELGSGRQVLVALWSVIRRLKQLAGTDGADPAAMAVVFLVAEHGPLRLTALAEIAGLDASTASRHVRNLEAAGHLSRTEDADDRRATRIAITDGGRDLLHAAMEARAQRFDEALAGWSAADRAALATLLTRFAEDLA
jgi:DNA-binding MarR family transcriptional regulator